MPAGVALRAAIILGLQACAWSDRSDRLPTENLPVEALAAAVQCGASPRTPAAVWLGDANSLAEVVAKSVGMATPQVDFGASQVLLIGMGQRSTTGYAVGLARDTAALEQGTLTVLVTWKEPGEGVMTGQMLTNPCLLVRVPRASFERVRVVDQDGRERAATAR